MVVLSELCWVLRRLYAATPGELADTLADLLNVPVLVFEGRSVALRALARVLDLGGEFPDALIHEVGASSGCSATYTFDRRAARRAGMTLLAA
jgi:predicted nucleic-acid-binding protein